MRDHVFTLVNDLELEAKQRVKRAAGPRPWDQSFRAAKTRQEKRRSPLVSTDVLVATRANLLSATG